MTARSLVGLVLAAIPFVGVLHGRAEVEPVAFDVGATAARMLLAEGSGLAAVPFEDLPRASEVGLDEASFVSAPRSPSDGTGARRRPTARGIPAPPLPDLRVSESRVLALANAGHCPSGIPVPAVTGRPAGIVLAGVSGLGIGVRDGDVLTHVEGVSVRDPGQVIAQVIGARAHRRAAMRGRLFRGLSSYDLVVEMPYIEEPPREEASARAVAIVR